MYRLGILDGMKRWLMLGQLVLRMGMRMFHDRILENVFAMI